MSYSLTAPCWHCIKRVSEKNPEGCTDYDQIQEAVNKIHSTTDGHHQGSGTILLGCERQKS